MKTEANCTGGQPAAENLIDLIQCHVARALSEIEMTRIRCAVANDLALPLQFYIDLGLVRRSTIFRDRARGLVKLRVVNGHASLTPDEVARYLIRLQREAAEKCQRTSVS